MTSIADLEIFARVVTAGSMSAAGRELSLSPAVVSKRISHLETRLGTRLFHRTTRQLQLTESGRGFYERVVHILATVREAEAFLASGHDRAEGLLRITAPSGFGRLHIAPHLGSFLEQYPNMSVDITVSDQVMDIMREGIDVAIRISELEDSSLVAKKLAPCRRFFCAAPQYLKKHGTPETLAELSNHKILLDNNAAWRVQGPKGLESLKLNGIIKTNSSDIVHEAVLSGCGIAFCSTWQTVEDLKTKNLIPILPEYREAPGLAISAVYPDKQYIPAKLRVFVEHLQSVYGSGVPYWDEGIELYPRSAQRKSLRQAAQVRLDA